MKNLENFKLDEKLEKVGFYEMCYNYYNNYNEEMERKWFNDEDCKFVVNEGIKLLGEEKCISLIKEYFEYRRGGIKSFFVDDEDLMNDDLIKISNGNVSKIWVNYGVVCDFFEVLGVNDFVDSEEREYISFKDSLLCERIVYLGDERLKGIDIILGKEVYLGLGEGSVIIVLK